LLQDRHHCVGDFLDADCFHTAEIDRAISEEARAAFDVMSQNNVAIAERPSEARLGRTKDCDRWDAKQCGKMHCTGVVRQQQTALAQLIDQLLKRGLPDPIYAGVAERSRDLLADWRVVFLSEQNPLHRRSCGNGCGCFSEALRQPAFGRSVFCAWGETDSYW
jgi:hypothetical protein